MRTYDITDKLDFENNPKIKVKNIEVEVLADAPTVLKLIAASDGTKSGYAMTTAAYNLLFSEKDRKKIDGLKLQAKDFSKLIEVAIALAAGNDPDAPGEE